MSGLAHITGGGLPGKLPAALPDNLAAQIDTAAWPPPPVFGVLQREGGLPAAEMFRVFNMGIGMAAICPEANVPAFCDKIPEAIPIGRVAPRETARQVILDGLS